MLPTNKEEKEVEESAMRLWKKMKTEEMNKKVMIIIQEIKKKEIPGERCRNNKINWIKFNHEKSHNGIKI